ncbi:NAD-dependent epimerase/dehydratase family protein [Vibrio breoganii]|uniref:NAD-dependent epimerase/dehydratase family protein n=1 Tax=Vibrio breoganii TaxID=553239 RepID=UPI000C853AC1|nr:NAD-dependent epimerase/dehydratase family protein [Vibrio breoganii]PMG94745.1 hypothetical protein BCU80_06110 [Vibrio breoganii]
MINVLVTSVGGGVGQSIVDSISHLKSQYTVVGLDISEKVLSRNQCDKFYLSPRLSEPSYLEFLLAMCKENDISILIPGNDGELELLSRNIEKFEAINVKVIVSPTRIVASSRNKYNWFKDYSHIINIVPTALYSDYIQSPESHPEVRFPVIAKPAAGSASSGIKIFLSKEELLSELIPDGEMENYVVQPYLMPKQDDPDYAVLNKAVNARKLVQVSEISCQIVYDQASEIIGTFISKNSLKNGVPVTIEPIVDQSICSVIEDIAEKLKAEKVIGPVNIQGRLTEQGLVFFEMNLRFTGITGNRSQFGFNEVSAVVDSLSGIESCVELSKNTNRIGARQVACTTFYPLEQKRVQTVLITGASSWAAKNFVYFLSSQAKQDQINLILSSRNPTALHDSISRFYSNNSCQFVGVDEPTLARAIGISDVVLNFASARPPHGGKRIAESTQFNLKLVDLLKAGNPGLVLNISSQSVYDPTVEFCDEKAQTTPSGIYGFSKLMLEQAFAAVPRFCRGTHVVNLRVTRLWGGNLEMDQSQFPYRMIDAMLGEGQFQVANASNKMNMLDVDDLSYSLTKLMARWQDGQVLPSVINLNGTTKTIGQLLSSLELELQKQSKQYNDLDMANNGSESHSQIVNNELAKALSIHSGTDDVQKTWHKMLAMYNRVVK